MIKKLFILFLSLLPLSGVHAQSSVGSWEVYANYLNPEQIIQTPQKVFFLSTGTLFSFDKNSDELYHYGVHNVMSEASVVKIFYNAANDYIVATYASGNIDVVKKDGKVINLPDIRDAVLQTGRTINDVSFGNGRMYVATNFGIVVYDDKRWEVKESGIYNKDVKYVAATDEYIAAYFTNDKKLGFMPADKTIRYFDNFILNDCSNCTCLRGLKGNTFLASNVYNSLSPRLLVFNSENNTSTFKNIVSDGNYTGPYECKDGYYMFNTVKSGNNIACIKQIDRDYNVTTTILPGYFAGKLVAMWDNPYDIYVSDANGISEYTFTDDGTVNVLRDSFKPEAVTAKGVGYITTTNSGKIYISSRGYYLLLKAYWPKIFTTSHINLLENGSLKDITPTGLTYSGCRDTSKEGYIDGTFSPTNTYKIIEDPEDPDAYFFSTLYDGAYKIKDGKQVAVYNQNTSSLILKSNYFLTSAIDIDGKGNLWVAGWNHVHMLPSEKRRLNEDTKPEDWITDFPGLSAEWDTQLIACKKSNMVFYNSRASCTLYVIDTNGTVTTADDKTYTWKVFIDQDGKEWALSEIFSFLEDEKGQVWVGTDQGVFIIPDPKKATDPNMRIQRIKVPRNDGTNFADYLLEGEPIYSLAMDGVNRKWIGTANSGAYLVSENGSQILEHFTPENSYLPCKEVFAIGCDKLSNAVYFGTTAGLVKYNSDASPGAEDFSEVYAYPNPVRPEYNGWITIAGLMDGSLVKIADAAGNVFFQGNSQGGMITWDGCDASGNRVKTGVYYVFASQNGESTSSGAVTKILVVK